MAKAQTARVQRDASVPAILAQRTEGKFGSVLVVSADWAPPRCSLDSDLMRPAGLQLDLEPTPARCPLEHLKTERGDTAFRVVWRNDLGPSLIRNLTQVVFPIPLVFDAVAFNQGPIQLADRASLELFAQTPSSTHVPAEDQDSRGWSV